MNETITAIIVGIFTALGSGAFGYISARKKTDEATKKAGEATRAAEDAARSANKAQVAGDALTPAIAELQRELAVVKHDNGVLRQAYSALTDDHDRDMASMEVLQGIVRELQDARKEDNRLISQLKNELNAMKVQLRERDETIRRQAETIVELQTRLSKVEKKTTGELHGH